MLIFNKKTMLFSTSFLVEILRRFEIIWLSSVNASVLTRGKLRGHWRQHAYSNTLRARTWRVKAISVNHPDKN